MVRRTSAISVQLQPKQPPRRKRRKVRAFAQEIKRLQADGYTCQEICDALSEVGVVVSRSTVQREAARSQPKPRFDGPTATAAPALGPSASPRGHTPAAAAAAPRAGDPLRSRQAAEAFFEANPSNPLLRSKETP